VISMRDSDFIHFGGIEIDPPNFDEARIIVLPLCYEHAPSYGSGSHEGPYHILKASEQLESMDEETFINWSTIPIHTLAPVFPEGSPEEAVLEMKAASKRVLKAGKFLLSLGGDHAITIGPVMAAKEIYPQLGVLQIDAHTDLRQEWNGSSYNHACVMRRLADDVKTPLFRWGYGLFLLKKHS
jgi:agmatinase